MAELIWTDPALSDLEEIAEYIALENPVAARTLVQRAFNAVERLERHPRSEKICAELTGGRYRELLCGSCRILYRIASEHDQVLIVYVQRSEREIRNLLLSQRENLDPPA